MQTVLLYRPVIDIILAWLVVVITSFVFFDRKVPVRPPEFKGEVPWSWQAPVPLRLRYLSGARPGWPGFERDVLASYAADRAAWYTEAIKRVRE